jgi:trans-aconitate methyltransferase
MDIAHEIMLRLLDGALHKAPLAAPPGRVLDVGTGTGIWAIDMAIKHPNAEVTGIDLRCNYSYGPFSNEPNADCRYSPIQPNWYSHHAIAKFRDPY